MSKYYPGDVVVAYESDIGIVVKHSYSDVYEVSVASPGCSTVMFLSESQLENINLPPMPYYKWIQLTLTDMLKLHKEAKNA